MTTTPRFVSDRLKLNPVEAQYALQLLAIRVRLDGWHSEPVHGLRDQITPSRRERISQHVDRVIEAARQMGE